MMLTNCCMFANLMKNILANEEEWIIRIHPNESGKFEYATMITKKKNKRRNKILTENIDSLIIHIKSISTTFKINSRQFCCATNKSTINLYNVFKGVIPKSRKTCTNWYESFILKMKKKKKKIIIEKTTTTIYTFAHIQTECKLKKKHILQIFDKFSSLSSFFLSHTFSSNRMKLCTLVLW